MNQCAMCGVYYSNYSHVCAQPSVDVVNQPPHYRQGEVECIDAIRSALGEDGFRAYCAGNVIKYAWRHNHKNGLEDLAKAAWYSRMASGDDPRLA